MTKFDLTGQIFGAWHILSRSHVDKHGNAHWNCLCSICGKNYVVSAANLRHGRSKACKMCRQRERAAKPPTMVGSWIVSEETIWKGKNSKVMHRICICSICGLRSAVTNYRLVNKIAVGCLKCTPKLVAKTGTKNRNYNGTKNISRTIFGKIQHKAAHRNINFDLSIEDMQAKLEIQNFKCALTGMDLLCNVESGARYQSENTASLDRIDSNKGYTKDNIQWVHKDVNKMKWDFSQPHFIELCKAVTDYANKRITN